MIWVKLAAEFVATSPRRQERGNAVFASATQTDTALGRGQGSDGPLMVAQGGASEGLEAFTDRLVEVA